MKPRMESRGWGEECGMYQNVLPWMLRWATPCTVGDGEAECDVRRDCLPKHMLLASGLWNILLSLEKALKYSCSFIIKLLFKTVVEHRYNFKQGTMLMCFQRWATHKPNSCNITCWTRAWTSESILLVIGSSPVEDWSCKTGIGFISLIDTSGKSLIWLFPWADVASILKL